MTKLNRILLVDDDPSSNFLNRSIIQGLDICNHISMAHDGQSALDLIKKSSLTPDLAESWPELIIVDVRMPTMDGFEFLEKFSKMIDSKHKAPVICMLTSSFSVKDRVQVYSSNKVKAFMYKPLEETELLKIIENNFN